MAQVVVGFEDYGEGRFPGVCAISGVPTEDFVVMRTPVRAPDRGPADGAGWAARIERFVDSIDVRLPQHVLLGRLPVSAPLWNRLQNALRAWRLVAVLGLLLLVWSAWAGAAWSPYLSVSAVFGIAAGVIGRRAVARRIPRPTVIHDGRQVALSPVSEEFVAAVVERS